MSCEEVLLFVLESFSGMNGILLIDDCLLMMQSHMPIRFVKDRREGIPHHRQFCKLPLKDHCIRWAAP